MPPGASGAHPRIEIVPLEPDPADTGEGSAAPARFLAPALCLRRPTLGATAMATRTARPRTDRAAAPAPPTAAEASRTRFPTRPRSTSTGPAACACRCARSRSAAASRRSGCMTPPGRRATTCARVCRRCAARGSSAGRSRPPAAAPAAIQRWCRRGSGATCSGARARHPAPVRPARRDHRGDGVRGAARRAAGGAGPERGRARAGDHSGQHQSPRARADDHRPGLPREDQRQHRQLGRALVDRRRGREAALGHALGRRYGDGPLHRRRHPRDPRVDRPELGRADRHGADLPGAGEGGRVPPRT